MLEANEGLENIFENAVKEAEKRRHEYVTIEHVLLALIKDEKIGTTLTEFRIVVGALIKDIEEFFNLDKDFLIEMYRFENIYKLKNMEFDRHPDINNKLNINYFKNIKEVNFLNTTNKILKSILVR